jgi:hypothetical protein
VKHLNSDTSSISGTGVDVAVGLGSTVAVGMRVAVGGAVGTRVGVGCAFAVAATAASTVFSNSRDVGAAGFGWPQATAIAIRPATTITGNDGVYCMPEMVTEVGRLFCPRVW